MTGRVNVPSSYLPSIYLQTTGRRLPHSGWLPVARLETALPKPSLRFVQQCGILATVKLNTTAGAFLCCILHIEKGKREAGASPARSRHCDRRACRQGAFAPVTEHCLGRRRQAVNLQPGNLPAAGYGSAWLQITRNWLYRKAPAETRGLFVLPFCTQKGLVFCWACSSVPLCLSVPGTGFPKAFL